MQKSLITLAVILTLLQNTTLAQTPAITYSSSTDGFSEIISSNDGTLEGVLTATLTGASFSNPSGTLTSPNDFLFTNLPHGLDAEATVSADGTVATITLTQDASSHQPDDDLSNLIISFKDAAFSDATSSEVTNADEITSFGISFEINPVLTYSGADFLEVSGNDGSVTGTHTIIIADGNFAHAGSTLTYGDDFNITNLPTGLSATANVSGDGTTLTVAITGNSDQHQVEDNVEFLYYEFENSAFDGGIWATTVFKYRSYAPSGIDFNDNPVLSYSSDANLSAPLEINALNRTDKKSYPFSGSRFEFAEAGSMLFSGDNTIQAYGLEEAYDFSSIESIDGNFLLVDDLIDFEFSADGKTLFVLAVVRNYSEVIVQYELSTSFDLSTASLVTEIEFNPLDVAWDELSSGEFETGSGGFDVTGFTLSSDGSKIFVTTNRGGVISFGLAKAYDLSELTFSSVYHTASNQYGVEAATIEFNSTGTYAYIGDETSILGYRLSESYDISTISFNRIDTYIPVSTLDDFNLIDDDTFYLLEGNKLDEYTFHADEFRESGVDNGSLDGSMSIQIVNAVFSHTSDVLEFGVDYDISNLPEGLIPTLSVSADGTEATLALSGAATAHARKDDVEGLIFSFENSAFNTVVDVKDIFFATDNNSEIPIRFSHDDDVAPVATFSTPLTSGAIASTFPITITFSEPVNDFDQEDVLIDPIENMGSIISEIKNFKVNGDNTSYTFDFVTESGDVLYGIRLYTLSVFDDSGNGNLVGDTLILKTGEYQKSLPVVEDQTFIVPNGATGGTIVGKLTGTDADTETLLFSIFSEADQLNIKDYFNLNANDEIVVNEGVEMDADIIDSFAFKIKAFDGTFYTEADGLIKVEGVLEVEPTLLSEELEIYPNPTNGELRIKAGSEILNYSLLDYAGNVIRSEAKFDMDSNSIDISNLKSGMYILMFHSKNESQQVKIRKY